MEDLIAEISASLDAEENPQAAEETEELMAEDTSETTEGESSEQETATEAEEVEKYSEAELRATPIDKVDPRKLSPELQVLHKAMLADYTRKTQALAEERKRIEAEKASAPEPKEKTIYDYYDENPDGTTAYLLNQINELAQEDPYANAAKITQLQLLAQDLKLNQKDRAAKREAEMMRKEQEFAVEVSKVITTPDMADTLTQFAVSELGYTEEALSQLTNHHLVGHQAALTLVKSIKQQYDRAQAKVSAAQKESKKPTTVEPAGTGITEESEATKLKHIRRQADATGDYTDYFVKAGFV